MHLNVLRARGWLLFLFGICLLLLDFVLQHVCHVLTIATSSPVCWPDPLGPCPILLQQVYFCAFAAVKCCSRRTLLLNMALGWLQCFSPAQSSLRQEGPKNPPIFQCRFPAARAPSALFLQEIKYFCVARQTKWRCQRERSRSRSANTKRQRRQKLRHVYKVLQWKSWKIKSSKFTKNPFSTKRCSTGLNRKENEEKQGEKPSTLSYPRSTFITQIK